MKKPVTIHPFLIAVAPILYLGAHNVDQISPHQVLFPAVLALLATAVLLGVVWASLRDYGRSAVIVSVFLIAFFTFGRLFEWVWSWGLFRSMDTLQYLLMLITLCIGVGAAVDLLKTERDLATLSGALTIVPAVMIAFALLSFLHATLQAVDFRPKVASASAAFFSAAPDEPPQRSEPILEDSEQLPDIYYIVLDGYAREDVLKELYDYDNAEFLDFLRDRDFYVADRSWSNYAMTFLSLASTLNMRSVNEVVESLVEREGPASMTRTPFYEMIRQPEVAQFLQSKGYRYVTFLTNWGATEESYIADITYDHAPILGGEFYNVLLRTTLLRSFAPSVAGLHLYTLEHLQDIPDISGPTFTFAHILLPHNPYVFDRKGNVRANIPLTLQFKEKTGGWAVRQEYVDQMIYLNMRMRGIIDHILDSSSVDPIIIIQADHGTASTAFRAKTDDPIPLPEERLAILNAYHVPEKMRRRLYPTITPVNTFRLLLSTCFGADYEPLPDKSYFAWYRRPYDFRDVTDLLSTKYNTIDSSTSPAQAPTLVR